MDFIIYKDNGEVAGATGTKRKTLVKAYSKSYEENDFKKRINILLPELRNKQFINAGAVRRIIYEFGEPVAKIDLSKVI
ncbi:MAG: hypothetical protein ABFS35_21480 [Bacteroidota bacterium]